MNAPDLNSSLYKRLVSRVNKTESGCWEWVGAKQRGYGKVTIGGTGYRAHRLMCAFQNGPAPADKPWALHKCHNKACVRGDHLYWGTVSDNVRDCIAAGDHWTRYRGVEKCIRGHEFTPENTYLWTRKSNGVTERRCRECQRERSRAFEQSRNRKAAA